MQWWWPASEPPLFLPLWGKGAQGAEIPSRGRGSLGLLLGKEAPLLGDEGLVSPRVLLGLS